MPPYRVQIIYPEKILQINTNETIELKQKIFCLFSAIQLANYVMGIFLHSNMSYSITRVMTWDYVYIAARVSCDG